MQLGQNRAAALVHRVFVSMGRLVLQKVLIGHLARVILN